MHACIATAAVPHLPTSLSLPSATHKRFNTAPSAPYHTALYSPPPPHPHSHSSQASRTPRQLTPALPVVRYVTSCPRHGGGRRPPSSHVYIVNARASARARAPTPFSAHEVPADLSATYEPYRMGMWTGDPARSDLFPHALSSSRKQCYPSRSMLLYRAPNGSHAPNSGTDSLCRGRGSSRTYQQ
ncbi:hypothetical protein CALCODRAFT_157651 [Calocera cornea HHB12733]|uniref:Uncharacterized protein n=1 Tax=Calocera cornea HHB12733 TaxID=1353952 RepID=A0A165I0F1_9BASI|nr:hypothetical protein CALCODRAFT_157651 [Calocera cornea HHB12733]